MNLKTIIEGAYLIPFGGVNGVLLDDGRELTLVDAGFPGRAGEVWAAVEALGRTRGDLRHLVLTHAHPDHIGSAAEIVRGCGCATYMSAADAPIAESGGPFRPMTPAPGILNWIGYHLAWKPKQRVEPVPIDRIIADGDVLPLAGGLAVVATPGHCAGQVALLWKGGELLIAGDVGTNILGVGDPLGFEDRAEGRRSQRKVAGMRFEAAIFGHGRPIRSGASDRIAKAWDAIARPGS
jgi:glyoxylase-like metal-dependent hydrolase (beta-lactamase superfamily II)